jgi:hypothetical protein
LRGTADVTHAEVAQVVFDAGLAIAPIGYGTAAQFPTTMRGFDVNRVRAALSDTVFERCAAAGAAMAPAEAVRYARHQIQLARERADVVDRPYAR